MKQKDIMVIAIVVIFSGLISTIVSSKIVSPPKARQQTVEVAPAISKTLPTPNSVYFNPNAYDPSYQIQIGPNANPDPFNGTE